MYTEFLEKTLEISKIQKELEEMVGNDEVLNCQVTINFKDLAIMAGISMMAMKAYKNDHDSLMMLMNAVHGSPTSAHSQIKAYENKGDNSVH